MAKAFGDKYKDLIKLNPNQKSLPNNDPKTSFVSVTNNNPYKHLIASGSNQKSLFNTNPGISYGVFQTKNPYASLIGKWDFTKAAPNTPFVGRDVVAPVVDVYYVIDGFVDDGYIEVQQAPAW